tara:strand:+ start:272449 stop:273426 length:978 start_codon:yes stop_codon:yes gene_type:complete
MQANAIFNIKDTADFEQSALEVFQYQAKHCLAYKNLIGYLNIDPLTVSTILDIPFLPIQFFKSLKISSNSKEAAIVFTSSGTTGLATSKHYVADAAVYEKSFLEGFHHFYGPIENYTILALLPAYLEREGSSLIYMVDDLIKRSKKEKSGFYLDNIDALAAVLTDLDNSGEQTILIGVSFALLDLVEKYTFNLKNTIIMETGGMKGRRKELIRNDLHAILMNGFGVSKIHSEYGMTELLSQAYSKGNGLFKTPHWMRVLVRDTEDPLTLLPHHKTGGLNIIDLANFNSCSFIATQDLGKTHAINTFEILGRFDHSDIRGCNLLIS